MTKTKKICAILLRLIALGATFSATIIMVTSHESTQVFNIKLTAKYDHSPAFKYFVIANAIASVYAFIALILISSKTSPWRLLLLMDLVITMLLTSSVSAALAIAQVGKKGSSQAGWLPICGQVPKYCDHVTGALISGFVAMVIYMVVLLYSLHNVIGSVFNVTA